MGGLPPSPAALSVRGRAPLAGSETLPAHPGGSRTAVSLLGRLGPTSRATFQEKRDCSDGLNFPPPNAVTLRRWDSHFCYRRCVSGDELVALVGQLPGGWPGGG